MYIRVDLTHTELHNETMQADIRAHLETLR